MMAEHDILAARLRSGSSGVAHVNNRSRVADRQRHAALPSSFSPPVAFHVTGFGVFNGVPDNPTTHLVKELPGELRARGHIRSRRASGDGAEADSASCASSTGQQPGALAAHDGCFEVNSHVVLDVSAQEGGRQVREMHARLNRRRRKKRSGGVSVVAKDTAGYPTRRSIYEDTISKGDGAAGKISGKDHNLDIAGGCCESAAVAGISNGSESGGSGRLDPEEEEEEDDNRQISVFVHCGVDWGGSKFKLESRGYNEATFRVPDEKGYWPADAAIDENNPDITHVRETTLPIADTLRKLDEMGWGPDRVQESTCAGRFVCNYVYYTSLGLCEEASSAAAESGLPHNDGRHSLFVHVPPFSVIGKEEQLSFVADCLAAIAECLGGVSNDPEEPVGTSVAGPKGVFSSAPANMIVPISPDDGQRAHPMRIHLTASPCQGHTPPQAPPSPAVPSRSNAGLPRAYTAIARSHSLPYSDSRRFSLPRAADMDDSRSAGTSMMIWDDDDFQVGVTKRASLPLPLLGEDEGIRISRFSSSPGAASLRHADSNGGGSSSGNGCGNRREYSSHRSHHCSDAVHEYEGEYEQETPAEVTKRRLVEAGFEDLDVEAAMATTGTDDMETNMQLLFDITPLLPRGSPAVGDIGALREFLSSSNDQVGHRRRGGGGGGAAPRHSSGGNRVRTRSVGSAAGMGGVSPKWAGDVVPKVMPTTNGSSPSPVVSSDTSTPRGRRGLLNRFRRYKKGSSSGGSSNTATVSPSPAKIPPLSSSSSLSSSSGRSAEAAATATATTMAPPRTAAMKERRPIVAQSSSATTWASMNTDGGDGGGGVPSPEYCRRTTGNSQSQSPPPPPDLLRTIIGSGVRGEKVDLSAGWSDTSQLGGATLRLVLLVRLDVGMGPGAIAAYCCRAVLAATRKAEGGGRADALAVWRDAGEAMVVLAVQDSRALTAVLEVSD